MITVDGAAHRKQRQVAQPAFHRQQVPAFAETIVRRALKIRDGWGDGEERDIYQDMMRLTLGTIGATLFRTELGDDIEQLNAGVSDIMDVYHAMVLLPGVKYLINVPFTPLNKFLKARKRLYATIERMIVEHRRRGASGEPDLLDMMLSAQEQKPAQSKPNILVIMGDDIGWFNPSIYHRGIMGTRRRTSTASARKVRCSPTTTPSRAARPAAPPSSPG